jgi:hypothetical protein
LRRAEREPLLSRHSESINQSHRYFDVACILDQPPLFGECKILRSHKKKVIYDRLTELG